MKKLLLAVTFVLGTLFSGHTQTNPPKKKVASETAKPSDSTKAKGAVVTKKDGTPDKRYKENKKLKKDGTPDKRFKENKTITKE